MYNVSGYVHLVTPSVSFCLHCLHCLRVFPFARISPGTSFECLQDSVREPQGKAVASKRPKKAPKTDTLSFAETKYNELVDGGDSTDEEESNRYDLSISLILSLTSPPCPT